jgi:hypothetical protein
LGTHFPETPVSARRRGMADRDRSFEDRGSQTGVWEPEKYIFLCQRLRLECFEALQYSAAEAANNNCDAFKNEGHRRTA